MRLFILFIALAACLQAQTTLNISGTSNLANGWRGVTVSPDQTTTYYLGDPLADQQTGQSPDDFVGTTTSAGFYFGFGTINGVDSIAFRTYMAGFDPKGFGGNVRIGLDANGDGAVDLFLGPRTSGNASSQGIVFQNPTGPGNYSPSTTNLGTPYGRIAFNSSNYSYQAISALNDPLWTNIGPNTNSMLSFSVPTQTLANTFATLGITFTTETYLAFISFTSTQANAINQDLYGSTGIVNDARFDAPDGGFGDYYDSKGGWKSRPIIPEPSTYGMLFMLISVSLIGYWRYKQRVNID